MRVEGNLDHLKNQPLVHVCAFRRNGDSDYSDGEEDFYYSEIEVNMDTLSEGLSSLTPTSPTTSGPPPVFPVLICDASRFERAHVITPLSQSAPSALCHIHTDHAYQVMSQCFSNLIHFQTQPIITSVNSGVLTQLLMVLCYFVYLCVCVCFISHCFIKNTQGLFVSH